MHIPDGFLTNRVALSLDVVSAATVLYAARRVKLEPSGRLIPLMGVLGAFTLAAQMLNFPVIGGTSGHLVGGALLAILLGPMAGFLTMTTVVLAQALFLQDGGLVAAGANIFNIAAVTTLSGYAVFHALGGARKQGKLLALASFAAGWISLVVSAVSCALMLAVSGVVALRVGLAAMTGYHALIGLAEGALTAGVLAFVARVRPDILDRSGGGRFSVLDWAGSVVLVAIPFAILVLAGSSDLPDPLQGLLAEKPVAGSEALDAPQRLLAYALRAGVFAALIAVTYLVSRLAHRWRRAK